MGRSTLHRGVDMETVLPRWDAKRDDCIEAFYQAAKACSSASAVARQLDRKFRPSSDRFKEITRSVVLGALHRPRLSKVIKDRYADGAEVLAKFKANNIVRPARPRANRSAVAARRVQPRTYIERPPTPAVIPELEPVRFEDGAPASVLTINESMCKFPIGDPDQKDFAFCGRGQTHGPYCADHARLCYQPTKRKRGTGEPDKLRQLLRRKSFVR